MDKVLAVLARRVCVRIERYLRPLSLPVSCAATRADLAALLEEENGFAVAILPVFLPQAEITWWELGGALASLHTPPEILVCGRRVPFRLWAGVLEVGGYDVLREPFTPETLQRAVQQGRARFHRRVLRRNGEQKPLVDGKSPGNTD